MSLIPCPNQIGCDSDYPVTNYSAEDPDPRSFIAMSTGGAPTASFTQGGGGGPPGNGPDSNDTGGGGSGTAQTGTGGDPPPLGSDYDNPIVTTFAESTESQEDAWNQAGNDNVSAMTVPSNTGEPGGGIVLNPGRIRPSVFGNDPQTCTINCPDGSPFSYTVPANKFRQLSKDKANAAAMSYACKQAQQNQICLGAIDPNAVVDVLYSQTIVADTANIPVTFLIISGDVPSWITPDVGVDRIDLVGTPAAGDVGSTSFTIQATDIFGNVMTRDYTITVTAGPSCDPFATPDVESLVINAGQSVYCSKTNTIFAISSSAPSFVLEININGGLVNSFSVGGDASAILYENTNQRLYVVYKSSSGPSVFSVSSYNPSTRTVISNTALTTGVPSVQPPTVMTYDSLRNKIWIAATNYLYSLNANTFAQTMVLVSTLTPFFAITGMAYCSNQDLVIMLGGYQTVPTAFGIATFNPATMGIVDLVNGGNGSLPNRNQTAICYNSNNGFAYGCQTEEIGVTPGQVLIIDPGNIAGFTRTNLTGSYFAYGVVYNPCIDKVVIAAVITSFAGDVKGYYLNLSDNTVSGTTTSSAGFSGDFAQLTYDSVNARVWMGTNEGHLLKFT